MAKSNLGLLLNNLYPTLCCLLILFFCVCVIYYCVVYHVWSNRDQDSQFWLEALFLCNYWTKSYFYLPRGKYHSPKKSVSPRRNSSVSPDKERKWSPEPRHEDIPPPADPVIPPASTQDQEASKATSDDGQPKRVRKGRGFTEKFAFARRYKTPSPERSPRRPFNYGGRNHYDSYRDRWCIGTLLLNLKWK